MDAGRRALLAGAGAWAALAAANWPRIAAAAAHAHAHADATAPAATGPAFLSPAQARTVEAIAARIVPTDDLPGAREAGVVHFIDRALGDFFAPAAKDFVAGLAAFDAACKAAHPAIDGFAALASADQDAFLKTQQDSPFFGGMRFMTVCGLLASPAYGGNRDGIGWKLIGFEDAHEFTPPFGYYDRDYPGYEACSAGGKP